MATFRSKHTNDEIEEILDRAEVSVDKPFYLYYDTVDKKYRFFATAEKRDAWVYARDNDVLTDEIRAYEFTDSFDAPAPSTIKITWITGEVRSERCGSDGKTSGVSLDYTFRTEEQKSGDRITEAVNVIYTIISPTGTNTVSVTYLPDTDSTKGYTTVSFNVDNYISIGTNTISMVMKGRTSGVTKTSIVSINVFKLALSSDFNIAKAIPPNTDIDVPFMVEGTGEKTLHIYVDGVRVVTRGITSMESGSVISHSISNTNGTYKPGKHTLQLQLLSGTACSDILYCEFVISGKVDVTNEDGTVTQEHQRQILIKTTISATSVTDSKIIVYPSLPTIYGTQYYPTELSYAFYSSDTTSEYRAQIQWEITNSGLQIQPIDVDSVEEAKVGTLRTLKVIPMNNSTSSEFVLHAYMKPVNSTEYVLIDNTEYKFEVSENSDIMEATSMLKLKLSAYGRSNNENEASKTTWTYGNYSTVFSSNTGHVFQWSGDYGWSDNSLGVKAGTWCRINNKPFADSPHSNLGCTFEIEFMTFDVDNDDDILLSIGNPSSTTDAYFTIRGSRATLVSQDRVEFETKFKSNERVKIAFILYPGSNYASSSYPNMVFIQVNGILSYCETYGNGDKFTIGSTSDTESDYGTIKIGGDDCSSSIKVYTIRVYNKYLNATEELNNFIIDRNTLSDPETEDTMSYKIEHNDIYTEEKQIDTTKLADQITVVQIDGDIQTILDAKSKNEVEVALTVTSPTDPSINIYSPHTKLSNAGQSTLGMPVPSMHVKLGAYEENKVIDADGVVLVGNRWSFRSENESTGSKKNVPEKKFRLQANYMDSSGCHNGAFLKLFNEVSKKVTINNKYVLLPPSMRVIYDSSSSGYSAIMKAKHGTNPNSSDGEWSFPYEMNMVPDSIPCVVIWKKPSDSTYSFLGQYVIMEEKKADFASGKRSIYSNIDSNNYPDPFTFKTSKDKNNTIWDNSNVRQFEIVNNVGSLTYFNSISAWDEATIEGTYRYENDFEMIYPDPDDIIEDGGKVSDYWNYFKNNFVAKVCATFNNQTEFDKLYNDGANQIFDRWAWASYYCLALRNCCVDSMVRNMEIMTFGEKNTYTENGNTVTGNNDLWLPKWWDVDMQCGLLQSGALGADPRSNRKTKVNGVYLFAGKNSETGESSWLWDALENCEQFKKDVNTIEELMYNAGWSYSNITEIQDADYVKSWNESLFNESGLVKYVNIYSTDETGKRSRRSGYEFMLQGDRTPHRHWFLKNNYSYYDALHVCGDYANYVLKFTPMYAATGCQFHLFPSEDNYYFGIVHNDTDSLYSGIQGYRGYEVKSEGKTGETLQLKRMVGSKDTLTIYGINKLEKIDISDFGRYFNGTLDFNKTKDSVLGTVLKELYLGVTDISKINDATAAASRLGNGTNSKTVEFDGLNTMTRLEKFNIRGLQSITDISTLGSQSITHLYAAGSGLMSINPKSGTSYTYLELPTSVAGITMDNCSIPNTINWYTTNTVSRIWYDTEEKKDITENSYYVSPSMSGTEWVPTSGLNSLIFTAMGDDLGTQHLILNWLHVIRDSAVITAGMTESEIEAAYDAAFAKKTLTYTDCNWNGISYDDLMLIARIPSRDRVLRGGYFMCGDEGGLTTSQMNTLMSKFGDYIFTENSLLMIDSKSNNIKITITGGESTITETTSSSIIEVRQGDTYQLGGIVFPVKQSGTSSRTFEWYLSEKTSTDSQGNDVFTPRRASQDEPIFTSISPIELNTKTGELYVRECSLAALSTNTLKICVDSGEKSGWAFLRIKRRVYPENVVINPPDSLEIVSDKCQIIDSGSYTFSAYHYNPAVYDGNLSSSNGGIWSLSDLDSTFLSENSTDTTYRLTVDSTYSSHMASDEQLLTLNYTSHWMDSTISRSASLNILLVSVIQELLGTNFSTGANRALYFCLNNHNGITHAQDAAYTSLDFKRGYGIINFKEYIEALSPTIGVGISDFRTMKTTNSSGNTYNLTKYLNNINAFNLSGCTYFSDDIDVAGLSNLTSLNMYETSAGSNAYLGNGTRLRNITYGTPTYINIDAPVNLTQSSIVIQNTSLLKDININKLAGGKEVTELINLINNVNSPVTEPLPSITGIHIVSDVTTNGIDNLGYSGKPLEQIYDLITNHPSLTSGSSINSTVKMSRIYKDTKEKVNAVFGTLTITNDEFYRRWNDSTFESLISDQSNGLGGDGTGLTLAQAATANTLNRAIKGNKYVKDLSDLYYFGSLQMSGNDNQAMSDFYDCDNIENVSIPSSLTYIGKNTFCDIPKLSSIDFTHAENLQTIKYGAFTNCGSDVNNLALKFGKYKDASLNDYYICRNIREADMLGFPNMSSLMVVESPEISALII